MTISSLGKIAVIGGTGLIGSGMIKQMLTKKFITPKKILVVNQSGKNTYLEKWPTLKVSTDVQHVADACQTIVLSIRPKDFAKLQINLEKKLVISVMAGVSVKQIQEKTGALQIVRSMPNAAIEIGESYTPWFATHEVNKELKTELQKMFELFGKEDQVTKEDEINFFTALTGSGQGWVAFLEKCFIRYATDQGIATNIADRSVRQLFYGMGKLLDESTESHEKLVKELINYAGTTAAGLTKMESGVIEKEIANALRHAYFKAKSNMGQD